MHSAELTSFAAPNDERREHEAAVRTLRQLGYTFDGGTLWKPPIGPQPEWGRVVIDGKSVIMGSFSLAVFQNAMKSMVGLPFELGPALVEVEHEYSRVGWSWVKGYIKHITIKIPVVRR